MAVTRLGAGAGGNSTGGAFSFNSPNVGSSDANTWAIVAVAISVSSNSTSTTCAVTYGGVAMTQYALILGGSGTSRNAAGLYYLSNPGTGTQTVTVTPGGSSTKARAAGQVVVFSGVANIQNGAVPQTLATSHTVTTSVTDGYVVRCLTNGATLSSPNQTSEYLNGATVSGVGDWIAVQSAAGSGSVAFTCSGTATTPNSVAVALLPVYAKVDTFSDSFSGSFDTTKWPSSAGASNVSGQLNLSQTAGGTKCFAYSNPYDIASSAVYVEVASAGAPDTWLDIFDPVQTNYYAGFYIRSDGNLQMTEVISGTADSTTLTYSATTHRWLRFRHDTAGGGFGTIYWDTSPDGTTWTNQRSKAAGQHYRSMQIALEANFNTFTQTIIVDNVNTPAGLAFTGGDTVGVTDALTKDVGKNPADTAGITDALTLGVERSAADSLGVTDTATAALGFNPTTADPVGVTDAAVTTQDWVRTPADTVGVTDALALDATRSATDPVGVTDSINVGIAVTATSADTLGVTDAIDIAQDFTQAAADTLGVTDQLTTAADAVRSQTDTVSVTDTATFQTDFAANAADTVGAADVLAIIADYQRSWTDPVGVADSATFVIVPAGNIGVADLVDITDTFSTAVSSQHAFTDTVGVTDAADLSTVFARALADTVDTSDVLGLTVDHVRGFTDSVGVTDSAAFTLGDATYTNADIVGLTDAARFSVFAAPGPDNTAVAKAETVTATLNAETVAMTLRSESAAAQARLEASAQSAKPENNREEV